MRNRLHVLSFCQQQALAGTTEAKFIAKAVAREFAAESPDGGVSFCGLDRSDILKQCEGMVSVMSDTMFPLRRRCLELDVQESFLRADLLSAMDLLPLENPREVRELMQAYMALMTQSTEASLRGAIEYLLDGAVDVATVGALVARVEELYPTPAVDE